MLLAWESPGITSRATYSVLGLNEGVVDGNDLDLRVLNGIAEDDAANTAETVDADLDDHFVCDGGE
jgi:hypothetical protein